MNVVIFGASGMVGKGVLLECLRDPNVEGVVVVGRSAVGQQHRKFREVLVKDLFDVRSYAEELTGLDACFFCLGVSSAGLSEAEYRRLTYDLTITIAQSLADRNTALCFVYVSGAGTDSSERGRSMWARVKGATENALLPMSFRSAYMFRPGVIQPLDGIRSKDAQLSTRLYFDGIYPASATPGVPELDIHDERDRAGNDRRCAERVASACAGGQRHSCSGTTQPVELRVPLAVNRRFPLVLSA